MNKVFFSILLLISSFASIAQKQSKKAMLDSLKQNDETMKMLDEMDKPSSYVKIGVGIGNQLFSVHNKALDASQTSTNFVLTPSIGYYHKSGFGISFAAYLLSDSGSTNYYQSSLTPSYEYDADNLAFGISYTRYFVKNKYGGAISPIQNDLYASLLFKKNFIRPAIAVGFSNGISNEINLVTVNVPQIGPITFLDTAKTKTTALSLIGSIEHSFEFEKVISGEDFLTFTPSLMLNAGSGKFLTTHMNKYSANPQNNGRRRIRSNGQSDNSPFALQSIGSNFAFIYSVGKFTIEPQLYLDYYLQSTTSNKFTQIYNINFSFSF